MNLPFISNSRDKEDAFNPFPDLSPRENSSKNAARDYAILSFALLLFASSIVSYSYFSRSFSLSGPGLDGKGGSQSAQAKPTPTPRPILQGEETYSISQSNPTGPRVTKAYIDNHDPKIGEDQTIKVSTKNPTSISEVVVKIKTDHDMITLPLSLSSGDVLNGIWSTTWEVSDTVLHHYMMSIKATAKDGTSIVDISIR